MPGPHAAAEGGETLQLLGVEGEQASNLLPPLVATLILLLLGLIDQSSCLRIVNVSKWPLINLGKHKTAIESGVISGSAFEKVSKGMPLLHGSCEQ